MSEEKLKEIKDSIDFQLRVCELNKYEPDMIIEEKELYDYAVNLQQENQDLRKALKTYEEGRYQEHLRIQMAIEYIKENSYGWEIKYFHDDAEASELLKILGDKE